MRQRVTGSASLPATETLEDLLKRGEVSSALLLKGSFTKEEREFLHQAYEFGVKHGRQAALDEIELLRESEAEWQRRGDRANKAEAEAERLREELRIHEERLAGAVFPELNALEGGGNG